MSTAQKLLNAQALQATRQARFNSRNRVNKIALFFPPLILAVNILEACVRDFQVGAQFFGTFSGAIEGEVTGVAGGIWNFFNGAAGILNIITIVNIMQMNAMS